MATAKLSILQRWQRLGRDRRQLLVRAALTLASASAGVAVLPFHRAIRFGSVDRRGDGELLKADDCVWAVDTAARFLPMRTMCIEKGLAVQRLLRRSGVGARLHYGVRHSPETGRLEAHVWVSVGGAILIGGEEAANFAEVATYG